LPGKKLSPQAVDLVHHRLDEQLDHKGLERIFYGIFKRFNPALAALKSAHDAIGQGPLNVATDLPPLLQGGLPAGTRGSGDLVFFCLAAHYLNPGGKLVFKLSRSRLALLFLQVKNFLPGFFLYLPCSLRGSALFVAQRQPLVFVFRLFIGNLEVGSALFIGLGKFKPELIGALKLFQLALRLTTHNSPRG
jgi:hypothetical protein